jgi:predicted peptidase
MRNSVLLATCLCVAAAVAGCSTIHGKESLVKSDAVATGFINKTMKIDGKERRYVVYVPNNYTPKKQWPLVLFLHGSGERGDDGLLQTDVGIAHAIRKNPKWFPCIVVMPQCPNDVWWDKAIADFETALGSAEKEYNIDPERVYMTGLSMGGFGTWMYGAMHPERFAALMPLCGGGKPEDGPALAKTPIWAFHGDQDKAVPVAKSREMVEAVKKAGGEIKYTEYPKVEHNCWDATYGDQDAIKWLLKQRKAR